MLCLTKWLSATLVIALSANAATAADMVSSGKVKSVNADNKTFVLSDSDDKDFTFKLGDDLIVNRDGKEGQTALKAGEPINVCYDKGTFTRTANYILVQEGASKNCELIHGAVKGYDAEKKELTFTADGKKDLTYPMGKAMVRLNREDTKIDTVKIGDHALLIVDTVEGSPALRCVMAYRAK